MSNEDKNPIDCSLFYLALRKKNVLLGLWKLATTHPEQAAMLKFLVNDFTQERWKSAALKNAFALLGKQRYEYAVAFFLLADGLQDAVSACLKYLNDVQLAILLCRVYEGDESQVLKNVINEHVILFALNQDDRWLASIGYAILKDKPRSLKAIVCPLKEIRQDSNLEKNMNLSQNEMESKFSSNHDVPEFYTDPALLILYNYLKDTYHRLRQDVTPISLDVELEFIYQTASAYQRMGCPALALHIIKTSEALSLPPTLALKGKPFPRRKSIFSPNASMRGNTITSPITILSKSTLSSNAENLFAEPESETPIPKESKPMGISKAEGLFNGDNGSSSGGNMDWGEPVQSISTKTMDLDAELAAFKTSMGQTTSNDDDDEDDLEVEPLKWGDDDDDEEKDHVIDENKNISSHNLSKSGTLTERKNSLQHPSRDDFIRNRKFSMSEVILDEHASFRFLLEHKNLVFYEWLLGMRIIQVSSCNLIHS